MDTLMQFWSLVALGVVLAVAGLAAKRLLWTSAEGWRGVGRKTMRIHPVLAGGLVALVPGFPVPAFVEGLAGAVLFGAFAGACSSWVYDAVRARWTGRKKG